MSEYVSEGRTMSWGLGHNAPGMAQFLDDSLDQAVNRLAGLSQASFQSMKAKHLWVES